MKWRFDKNSFIIAVVIFFIEILIAKFVDDAFIRPYGGDILVVVLIYYFVRSFVQVKPLYLVIAVLLFAYAVETGQYFRLVDILGLRDYKIMRIVIGTSFAWGDILCYTIGGVICYLADRKRE
jgi:ABC-type glycerol-3-phosphate transport system permease component